ncbi:cysteine peptidase family C39 domain-containing protein [Pseudobutyrivibrio sp.]
MTKFPFAKQHDSMQCGAACLFMICRNYGMRISLDEVDALCVPTKEGMSMFGLKESAIRLGFKCSAFKAPLSILSQLQLPCLLHWNQSHFVVLYEVKKNKKKFKVADPGKGIISYSKKEFESHWISSKNEGEPCGIVMELTPTESFYNQWADYTREKRSFCFLFGYIKQYRRYFFQIILGLLVGCLLQLSLPFLTQNIVDVGIKNKDIGFIWLILIGQLVITFSRTSVDFIRRWLLLHISMRINISLVSDFFIKLLQLPMSFFDIKLMGDLMQRIGDHSRVNSFLTQQTLNVAFSLISFAVFSCVLLVYNRLIFFFFLLGSLL